MSELDAYDIAWQAANDANEAFAVLAEKDEQLKALQVVGSMSVEGIVIPAGVAEELESERDEASRAFADFQNTAAPAMLDPQSPFASDPEQPAAEGESDEEWFPPIRISLSGSGVETQSQQEYAEFVRYVGEKGMTATRIGEVKPGQAAAETIFNFGAAARTRSEIVAFGRWRGYPGGSANAAFGPLWKASVSTTVEVPSLEAYEQTVTDGVPSGLVRIRTPKSHAREARPDDAFDIRTLHKAVVEWLRIGETGIKYLNERGVSFWADYLNHALPGIEPLRVDFPPSSAKKVALEKLPKDRLLFETAQVEGQNTLIVNHKTLRQFAAYIGVPSPKTSNFLLFFESVARIVEPTRHEDKGFVFVGSPEDDASSVGILGIKPERFIALVEAFGEDTSIAGYTEFSRPIIAQYVEAIKQFLADQAPKQ